MPLFKQKKCLCGTKFKDVEVSPNPLGDYYCPVCGRPLALLNAKVKPRAEEAAPEEEAPEE